MSAVLEKPLFIKTEEDDKQSKSDDVSENLAYQDQLAQPLVTLVDEWPPSP
jgi:hypothetical protein